MSKGKYKGPKYTKICPNCGCSMSNRFDCELYCENCGRRETIFGSVLYKGRKMGMGRRWIQTGTDV